MEISLIISAFFLGLVSSAHCIGMCGPIALSLPVSMHNKQQRVIGVVLYNLGRVISYSILGVIFGLLGRQIFLAGTQQLFSIICGGLVLLYIAITFIQKRTLHFAFFQKAQLCAQQFLQKAFDQKGLLASFSIGLANGLLPCGMVYLAITGAMATGTAGGGALFMVTFGAGTVPAMLLLAIMGSFMSFAFRSKLKALSPYIMACMAALLILRGLNLGIPYLSPHFDNSVTEVVPCH